MHSNSLAYDQHFHKMVYDFIFCSVFCKFFALLLLLFPLSFIVVALFVRRFRLTRHQPSAAIHLCVCFFSVCSVSQSNDAHKLCIELPSTFIDNYLCSVIVGNMMIIWIFHIDLSVKEQFRLRVNIKIFAVFCFLRGNYQFAILSVFAYQWASPIDRLIGQL